MKYIIPALLALALGWTHSTDRILASEKPDGIYKPTITAFKDGVVEDRLTYRREFDTLEECQAFVVSNDETFIELTKQALKTLVDRGDDMATLTCELVPKKPSI
jgi:hypothetical protein